MRSSGQSAADAFPSDEAHATYQATIKAICDRGASFDACLDVNYRPGVRRLRCGARRRDGGSCRQPRMANGRCRMHGGKSAGPRTAESRPRQLVVRRVDGAKGDGDTAARYQPYLRGGP
jgi:hypothetical protein